jgi:hypothetical protein
LSLAGFVARLFVGLSEVGGSALLAPMLILVRGEAEPRHPQSPAGARFDGRVAGESGRRRRHRPRGRRAGPAIVDVLAFAGSRLL